jgi:hypothetical protein
MKKLDTSPITDSASMPVKSGSLQFLQEAHQETTVAVVNAMLGYTPDPTKGYIIQGVNVTVVGSNYTITDGYIYFNGEIFKLNASSFTLAGGQQVYATITNVPYPAADPVMFGDNVLRTVHLNRQMTFSSAVSGDLLYINCIKAYRWLAGDIKMIACNNTYLSANFDGTGLGTNERLGWAIMNGQNATTNMNATLPMPYGTSNATLLQTGGYADTVLVAHTHTVTMGQENFVGGAVGNAASNNNNTNSGNPFATRTTSTAGGSETGVGKNVPPFTVVLYIQKL